MHVYWQEGAIVLKNAQPERLERLASLPPCAPILPMLPRHNVALLLPSSRDLCTISPCYYYTFSCDSRLVEKVFSDADVVKAVF
jgi:hypothetical protein